MTTIRLPGGAVESEGRTLPDRRFRNAWRLDGDAITIDLAAARAVVRARADAALEATARAANERAVSALLGGIPADEAAARAENAARENARTDAALNAVQSVPALAAWWDSHPVLGSNPFA